MTFTGTYRAYGQYRPAWDAVTADRQVSRNTSRAVVMRFAHERGLERGTKRSAPAATREAPDSETAA